MERKRSGRVFGIINGAFLFIVTLTCLAPLLHMLALSLSSNIHALTGEVTLWPKGFTLNAYRYLAGESRFWTALTVTLRRVVFGTALNMSLCILTAYPLSKEVKAFRGRTAYVWYFAITMFFGGGLIPLYIIVGLTGLMDTIWALILPGALNVWFVVLLLNFFRGVPKELEEAAIIDGASQLRTLVMIYLPVSLPALATIMLFSTVNHWNAWFDGFIFMNFPRNYPLQTYLASLVMQAEMSSSMRFITPDELEKLSNISHKTLNIAQIFMGMIPIMLVYPFLQRYYLTGIVIGSVKG